jgi:hypothetical protein
LVRFRRIPWLVSDHTLRADLDEWLCTARGRVSQCRRGSPSASWVGCYGRAGNGSRLTTARKHEKTVLDPTPVLGPFARGEDIVAALRQYLLDLGIRVTRDVWDQPGALSWARLTVEPPGRGRVVGHFLA